MFEWLRHKYRRPKRGELGLRQSPASGANYSDQNGCELLLSDCVESIEEHLAFAVAAKLIANKHLPSVGDDRPIRVGMAERYPKIPEALSIVVLVDDDTKVFGQSPSRSSRVIR